MELCAYFIHMTAQDTENKIALVVEDEAIIALEIEHVLNSQEFCCVFLTDTSKIETVTVENLAVAIVDIKLWGCLTGPNVIRSLRKRVPHLPVVVVTGFSFSFPEADLRGLGGPTVRLTKPADPNDLLIAVGNVVGRGRSSSAPQSGRRRSDTEPT